MAIYEYRCRGCGHDFELMRPMSDRDAETACPKCESKEVGRKISAFAASVPAATPGCPPARAENCGNYG